jgi:hypothetical protein
MKNHVKILLIYCLISLLGCAEPKYLKQESNLQNEGIETSKANCLYRFNISGLCLSWYWESRPTTKTTGSLIFKIFKINNFDQTDIVVDTFSTPQLILWMQMGSTGHGSSPTQVTKLDTGTFRAANIFFVMTGEWQLKFQFQNENGILDEKIINYTFNN